MPNSLPTDRASLLSMQAEIAAILAASDRETPQETIEVTYYLHDGSDERPAIVPSNVRVLYYHKTDNALVLTNSDKLRSWRAVKKFIFFADGEPQFRTFARSKSRYAL